MFARDNDKSRGNKVELEAGLTERERERERECHGTHESYEFFHETNRPVAGSPQERNNGLLFRKLFSVAPWM